MLLSKTIVVSILIIVVQSCSSNIANKSISDLAGESVKYMENGDYETAIANYLEIKSRDTLYPGIDVMLGSVYLMVKDTGRSLYHLNLGITKEPMNPDPYYLRGQIRYDKHLYKDAIEDLKFYTSKEDDAHPQYLLGACYLAIFEDSLSVIHLNKAIDKNDQDEFWFYTRAYAKAMGGNYEEAMDDCNYALKLDSEYASCIKLKGYIYFMLGDNEKACLNYQKALKFGDEHFNFKLDSLCRSNP